MRIAIILLAIMAVFCALPSVQSQECDLVCSQVVKPVCGVPKGNPMTFSNKCEMDLYNCVNKKEYIVKRPGRC